ncbi:MAG TPA: DUF92 domain-containing protein [Gemmatimonadales bacterium]|nr:DUF92 domain-containing protein [Gemmatimonadales bacterium]
MTWLTPGGVAAALLVGASVWLGLGWRGFIPLFFFLLSGSLLTRLATGASPRRTGRQVLANGGIAAAAALFGRWPEAAGALAAAAADTWATEIGAFSPTPPRLITSGASVPAGRSGGITPLGTAGGLAGSAAIAVLAALVAPLAWRTAAIVTAAGCLGMLADSLLGATLQAGYACPACGMISDQPVDRHGHEPGHLVRGVRWLDNDLVNVAGSLVGALLAWLGTATLVPGS